jgi:hypothetical protein
VEAHTPDAGVRLHAIVRTDVPAEQLARLPFDFERYVEIEPRLRSARWLTPGGPQVGARAEIVAEIPFTLPLLHRVFGAPEVIATVAEWAPPGRTAAWFEGRRFTGEAGISLSECIGGSDVTIEGHVEARALLGRLALRPLRPLVERLAARAIERGVHRAAAAVGGSGLARGLGGRESSA